MCCNLKFIIYWKQFFLLNSESFGWHKNVFIVLVLRCHSHQEKYLLVSLDKLGIVGMLWGVEQDGFIVVLHVYCLYNYVIKCLNLLGILFTSSAKNANSWIFKENEKLKEKCIE